MSTFKTVILLACAIVMSSSAATAQRAIKAPDIGKPENAPSSVYYENDYFTYSDDRLDQLKEPSLWKQSKDPNAEGIRFFWVPSEGEVLTVRVEVDAKSDKATLFFKRSTGVTETSWGTVAEETSRELKADELKELNFRFNFMAYWRIETDDPDDYANSPGPLWLFEAVEGGKYHAVHRQNPTMGETKRLGLLMLSFAGLDETDVQWPKRPVASKPPAME